MLIHVVSCATPVYRILVIAPRLTGLPDLNIFGIGSEVANLQAANSLSVDALVGTVTRRDIAAQLLDQNYNVIHLITHGNTEGVVLSDEGVSGPALGRLVVERRIQIILLLACDSAAYAQIVADVGVDYVIGITGQVPDAVAGQFATDFYTHLQRRRNPEQAFKYATRLLEPPQAQALSVFRPTDASAVAGITDAEALRQILAILEEHVQGTQRMSEAWIELQGVLAANAANQRETNSALLKAVLGLGQAIQATNQVAR